MGYASAMAWLLFARHHDRDRRAADRLTTARLLRRRDPAMSQHRSRRRPGRQPGRRLRAASQTASVRSPPPSAPRTLRSGRPRRHRSAGRGQAQARPARRADGRRHRARLLGRGLRLPLHLAGQRVVQAARRGLRQQAHPRRPSRSTTTCRCGAEAPVGLWLLNTLIVTVLAADDGDDLVGHGRVGLLLLPVPRAVRAVRARARVDDAARRRDDDPDIPDLEFDGIRRHTRAAVGAEPVRAARSTSSYSGSSCWGFPAICSTPRAWTGRRNGASSGGSRCR